ncbi:MAG: glycosyltransferase family 2 protein [Candidatus Berkelbacteria bacterium]|nr:glycosyltransferase family 2 protein [Candidatus Berkelbacteria bacterium]
MKWQILIPSIEKRSGQLAELKKELFKQIMECGCLPFIDVISLIDSSIIKIGAKRNRLLELATADYVSFFDDDDLPASCYIKRNMEGIDKGVDCNSLIGVLTWEGTNPQPFEHSIKYKEYKTVHAGRSVMHERYPNHLNVIKSSIAKQFKFPEINNGEDTDWATQIFRSGLIKTEHEILETIYHYRFNTTSVQLL